MVFLRLIILQGITELNHRYAIHPYTHFPDSPPSFVRVSALLRSCVLKTSSSTAKEEKEEEGLGGGGRGGRRGGGGDIGGGRCRAVILLLTFSFVSLSMSSYFAFFLPLQCLHFILFSSS